AFSIYVVHWPLFVLARRTLPLDGAALVSVELAVALVAGFWLHPHVETPLLANGAGTRLGPVLTDRRVVAGAALALALVVALAGALPGPGAGPACAFAGAARRASALVAAGPDDHRPVVALFGGSTAASLGAVAADWPGGQEHLRVTGGSTL